MARRLHSDTLGGSRKWAALETHAHRMLYDRAIDITDPYGNFDADPVMFRARAVPRLEVSIEEVAAALDDMERVGLIDRWEVDGNPYAHIVDFEIYNKPDPAKEAQTRIPGPDGVVPTKPGRTDRPQQKGKSKAVRKQPRNTPEASPKREPDAPKLEVGREVGTPRARPGQEVGVLDVDGDVDKRVLSHGSSDGVLSQSTMSASADDPLESLIEIWNANCGSLRKVRDKPAALVSPELTRLSSGFVKRHGLERAQELFKTGISAVATDPYWLGKRAQKVTRNAAPYGILGYLRHVEDKYEAALSDAEESVAPPRPWREYDIADHLPSGVVAALAAINEDGTAITVTGETWNLSECVRCNN